jgi:predicted molibdopterin-dependent oxidoreductase YjgC
MIGRETTSAFDEVFQEMAREVPAFHGLTWSALGDAGLAVRC